jgi:hypothetical protein
MRGCHHAYFIIQDFLFFPFASGRSKKQTGTSPIYFMTAQLFSPVSNFALIPKDVKFEGLPAYLAINAQAGLNDPLLSIFARIPSPFPQIHAPWSYYCLTPSSGVMNEPPQLRTFSHQLKTFSF